MRIDNPNDLEKNIDVWRDAKTSMCTTDSMAPYKMVNGRSATWEACPDLGAHAVLKVTNYSDHALDLLHLRAKGLKTFNGLRGCREFVHGPAK